MSFAQEMKDFLSAFTAIQKTNSESNYQAAMSEYYRNGGRNGSKAGLYGYGAPKQAPKTQTILGALLGGHEVKTDPELSATDEGAKNITAAREQALRTGDMAAVKKLDADAADLLGMSKPKAAATAKPKPKAAIPAEPAPDAAAPTGKFTPPPTPAAPKAIDQINYNGDDTVAPDPARLDEAAIPDMATPDEPYTYAYGGGLIGDGEDAEDGLDTAGEPAPAADDDSYSPDAADDGVSASMSNLAAPGVAAGLRAIQANVTSNAALPEADSSKATGVNALANNEGAASHEEVAAIDRMIDPEGKLPAQARSAARIAAIWDTLGEKDPDKAAQLAQGLLLYDKKNSQTRGALAEEALRQGDTEKAVKYVADAYNNDLPGGARIIPAVASDGEITAKVIQDGKVVGEEKVSPEQMQGLVTKVANGSAYIQALVPLAAAHDARKSAKTAVSEAKAARGRADPDVLNDVLLARRAYARSLDSSDGSEDAKKNVAAQKEALDAAEEKAIGYAMKQQNPAAILKQLGIGYVPSAVTPKPTTTRGASAGTSAGASGRTPNQTASERAALADQAEVAGIQNRLYNADSLQQAGVSVGDTGRALPVDAGSRSEAARVENARRTIEPKRKAIEDQLAGVAYNQAEDNKSIDKKPYGERVQPLEEALNGYLTEKSPNANKPIEMSPADRRATLRLADRISQKNDIDPRQIIEFIDGATNDLTQPVKVDHRTGMVTYGSNKLFVDGDTLMAIAQKRGETVKSATADRNKKWTGEAQALNDRNDRAAQAKAEAKRQSDIAPSLADRAAKQNLDIVNRQGPKLDADNGMDVYDLQEHKKEVIREIREYEGVLDYARRQGDAQGVRAVQNHINRLRKQITTTP